MSWPGLGVATRGQQDAARTARVGSAVDGAIVGASCRGDAARQSRLPTTSMRTVAARSCHRTFDRGQSTRFEMTEDIEMEQ